MKNPRSPLVMDKGGEGELRQAVFAELSPSGPVEDYLAGCIAQALSTLTASPDDPFALVARNDLFENLRELHRLQAASQFRAKSSGSDA